MGCAIYLPYYPGNWIEIAHSLSADSAIMAIQRFGAKRGMSAIIYSDNGTNFCGTDQELRDALDGMNRDSLVQFALKNKILWKFIPPSAPHMGGAWERMVRSVKECMGYVLRGHVTNDETLRTIMAEIEHSVNSRPLVHIPPDPDDGEALTPNHFLLGSLSSTLRLRFYGP